MPSGIQSADLFTGLNEFLKDEGIPELNGTYLDLKKEVYFPNFDSPRNVFVTCESELCELRVMLSHTTYLEFEPGVEDIIESEFIKNGGAISVSKIY